MLFSSGSSVRIKSGSIAFVINETLNFLNKQKHNYFTSVITYLILFSIVKDLTMSSWLLKCNLVTNNQNVINSVKFVIWPVT